MKLLKLARERLPDCEVVMVTGHATVPVAVEAMQKGAFNFLEKPITPNRLRAIAEKAAQAVSLRRQNTELLQRLDERFGFEGIIYVSKKMQTVIDIGSKNSYILHMLTVLLRECQRVSRLAVRG